MPAATEKNRRLIILILGALCTVSPFSIDMYLPAFAQIAKALHTTEAHISLSVSAYFVGLAAGQLFYGPLLDRFGRKRPIYGGLALYVAASLACAFARNAEQLVAFRFLQSLGGCVAQVAAFAMVRDFFPVKESAKIFSLLMLILGVSPLFAPTTGSFVAVAFGWQWVFALLAAFAALCAALVRAPLPEGHRPDPGISLHPKAIAASYLAILGESHFTVAAFAGAFSFAGLFAYVAGSPIIFLDYFHIGPRAYGLLFAVLAAGFIGASNLNIWLSKYHEDRRIFHAALVIQNAAGAALFIGTACGWFGLPAIFALLFIFLGGAGLGSPNAAGLALAPFTRNAGSASALLGFLQMGVGAACSSGIGLLNAHGPAPIFAVMWISAFIGLVIYTLGKKRIARPNPRGL